LTTYEAIRNELSSYSAELAAKPEIVAANKMDMPGAQEKRAKASGIPFAQRHRGI
jgi:GTPase involved in cell partitioning and DNA repair